MKNIKTYEEYEGQTFKEYVDKKGYDICLIISLTCSGNNIKSLDGIEKYTKLKEFFCQNNKLTSLDGIEKLTNLKEFFCGNNQITSLKPIENLTKLVTLFCYNNPIDWVDYIDEKGRTYYIKLSKSIEYLSSDRFKNIDEYWEFMDQNQPVGISRKFNF